MDRGYEAADLALKAWLDDKPWIDYLEQLGCDDLRDAASHLLIQLGALLCKIYGSQPEAAAEYPHNKLISGYDVLLRIDGDAARGAGDTGR